MANVKKKPNTTPSIKHEEVVTESETQENSRIIAKDIDLNQYITVRNGFQGRLVYKSSRTGEHFVWDEFGAEQEMELRELRDAKNSNKKMFINNWFMFDESWIIEYLGVGKYYKSSISIADFDTIFTKTPTEIKKIIGGMSDGQKKSVSYRARQLIRDGEIDSRKSIAALEDALNIELIEK